MLKFNNNHIFTGYLKQFLSSFNLPTCKIYTAEFEKFYSKHGYEDPRVIESNLQVLNSGDETKNRPATGITYLKDGYAQQYFWDTSNWDANLDYSKNKTIKYWKSNQTLHYNGNKILGLTKTLQNPTTLYNCQTHEYLGDYLRFLRDYENINLMSMYNCFSHRLCNNIKINYSWERIHEIPYTEVDLLTGETTGETELKSEKRSETVSINVNAYDSKYKIYMLPVKLFENYTIAIDCFQGVELFCGFYNETFDSSEQAKDLLKRTYTWVPKALFNQPFIYDKLHVKYWNWKTENTIDDESNNTENKILRSEVALRERELKLFIKIPATNTSSITILEGDYCNFNDALYKFDSKGWQYKTNFANINFETKKTYKQSTLPDINSREFRPISKLQLLALNTGISYPFADRLIEYLIMNVILPNDVTPDNIKRLQKVMEDYGYSFQINGIWEPKMQMILYDYLMNSGKFTAIPDIDENGVQKYDKNGEPKYKVKNGREGNLRQMGQKMRSDFYDILGYADKDAEKLYASWTTEKTSRLDEKGNPKYQATTKTTLENVDIYSNLYNN